MFFRSSRLKEIELTVLNSKHSSPVSKSLTITPAQVEKFSIKPKDLKKRNEILMDYLEYEGFLERDTIYKPYRF